MARMHRPKELAHGRWLGDFGRLSAAERRLVAAAAAGEWCGLAPERPIFAEPDMVVRAGVIRFLALGGDALHPVHEAGVQVQGGWVTGGLRLSACEVVVRINLRDCALDAPIHAYDARLRSLNLAGSRIPGLRADRAEIRGGLFLHRGFEAIGAVSLAGAEISGDFDARAGSFASGDDTALDLTHARIRGQLLLGNGFAATRQVRLIGAEIGGNLVCSGGRFSGDRVPALAADGIRIGGHALFADGSRARGEVRLAGAAIGGHLWVEGATLDNPDGAALHAENIRIGQALILRNATIKGRLVLVDAEAKALADDLASWPRGASVLDGFRYCRITGAPVDAQSRIAWLEVQPPIDRGEHFRSQPWEQLVRVLRDMGHPRDAAAVAIAKQRALRRTGHLRARTAADRPAPYPRSSRLLNAVRGGAARLRRGSGGFAARLFHDAYGLFAGYGHRPERIGLWVLAVWAAAGLYFSVLGKAGVMAPSEPTILIAALDGSKRAHAVYGTGQCGIRNEVAPKFYWVNCPGMPSEYPHFDGWTYAADLVLPVVDFRQFDFWAPATSYTDRTGVVRKMREGTIAKMVQWALVLFGWAMSLLFGAIVTRLIERD